MTTFKLPDLGEGLQEAEIVAWHVGVGDHVVADQPLVSVETEKAVVEVPSPQSGRIARLHGAVGDILKIGAPLVEFEGGDRVDSGTVVGAIPAAPKEAKAQRPGAQREAVAKPAIKAPPAVRALAERLGVRLSDVTASGPDGSVTRADVERAAAGPAAAGAIEPLRGVRRVMAKNMERAHAEVVPATVTELADVGDWTAGTDVTIRLVRAIAVACAAEPALNAWYFAREAGRRLHDYVDLGIAVDTPDGLIVPTLRDVGRRDATDLRRGLDALKRDVTARKVPLEELRGQTITLSNFGMFSGIHAALVVMPPQVAIIGAGRMRDLVVPRGGAPTVRSVLPVSLTFDHRAVMGGEASRFLAVIKADLEKRD
jgi:pyruvate dehydrogenase E2 component (dihydrolipoamide acetyltransferase)